MYRINRLSRPVLITVDEVIAKAVVDENADMRYILNSIEVAEERFIVPELGSAMYEDFIAQKNLVVSDANRSNLLVQINASLASAGKNPIQSSDLVNGMMVNAIELCSAQYQALWNRYLWKIVAEAVDILAIVPSWTRSTAQGQQQNNPKTIGGDSTGSATADRKDVQYKVDEMCQSRLYPLIARMKQWIQATGGYTLFPCEKKGDGVSKRSNILLGLYEDRHSNPNGRNLWTSPFESDFCQDDDDDSCGSCAVTPAPTPIPIPQTEWRSIKIYIKDAPDPNKMIPVGGGKAIQAEYASGPTVIPMKIGDAAGYLANRPFFNNITLNNEPFPDEDYDSTTGTFSGGFTDGMSLKITFLDNA